MIKKTVRDQAYTLETYLGYVNSGDICDNADVQRLAGSFDKREVNELVYTALTSDHIPELILAECNEDNRTYIADGLQRTTMLSMFKYGNHKITSAIDNSIVEYMKKKRDINGNIIKNGRGQIEFEEAAFDIKNKTFESLPEELQKVFNDFQIRIVIHEDCTMKRISDLIKRYNYQRPMTASQKAFTYMDVYAVVARGISNMKFFTECRGYTEKEKINGTIERVVTESVMCMFHFDDWKASSKSMCEYLNENSNDMEFKQFENIIERLGNIVTRDFDNLFTSKNSFIWFNIYNKFTKYGIEDKKFQMFLRNFNEKLSDTVVNIKYKEMKEVTYNKLDKESGTKDKVLVEAKMKIIEVLMMEYLHIVTEDAQLEEINILEFVRESVGEDVDLEDIEFYEEMLEELSLNVDNNTILLDDQNRPSLLAIISYSCHKDIDLDDWFVDFFSRTSSYILNTKDNYIKMREDLGKYIAQKERKSA